MHPISHPPLVAVTATTEIIRGVARVRVNEAYTDALRTAGLLPLVVPPFGGDGADWLLDGVHGLVLTGGEDIAPSRYRAVPHPTVGPVHETRDECEIALVRGAHERGMPTLAICRGVQVANVALGGTLVQDIPSHRTHSIPHDPDAPRSDRVHEVSVVPGSRLAAALGTIRLVTNSFHHQSIDRVASDLRVNARTRDDVIEGVESEDARWWMLGVQWHPEELTATPEDWDRRLFAAFAERVVARAA